VMTPEAWHGYLLKHGSDNITAMLKRPPTDFDEDMQLEYATVLISWLSYEGALPRQPTPRQRKRANAKKKKKQQPPIQVGEGAWGGARAEPQNKLQLEDYGAFPKLVEQETREELCPPVPLTPVKDECALADTIRSKLDDTLSELKAWRLENEKMRHTHPL